jgi:hypothetical protein
MTQSLLSTGTWLLGFRWVEGGECRIYIRKATGERWAKTATTILRDGRLHSARSERLQLQVDWWLTSATGSTHDAVHAALLR